MTSEDPAALPQRFVFLDTEATGLDEARHELTEIAWIVRFEDGREVVRQYFPHHTIDAADEAALELTAYHERIAPQRKTPMSEWLLQFLADAHDAVIVGAVPDFDIRHLLKACRRLGVAPTWDHHLVDVGTLALPLVAERPEGPRSLARTCEALGIEHDRDRAHGALYDAEQAKAVFDRVWAVVADLRARSGPLPPAVPRPGRPEGTAPAAATPAAATAPAPPPETGEGASRPGGGAGPVAGPGTGAGP